MQSMLTVIKPQLCWDTQQLEVNKNELGNLSVTKYLCLHAGWCDCSRLCNYTWICRRCQVAVGERGNYGL